MEETKFTTDADVILRLYEDYKNLQARYKILEEEKDSFRDTVLRIIDMVDKEEIRKARSSYNDRDDVKRIHFDAEDIRRAVRLPNPDMICEEADRILREREEGIYEDEESKSNGE